MCYQFTFTLPWLYFRVLEVSNFLEKKKNLLVAFAVVWKSIAAKFTLLLNYFYSLQMCFLILQSKHLFVLFFYRNPVNSLTANLTVILLLTINQSRCVYRYARWSSRLMMMSEMMMLTTSSAGLTLTCRLTPRLGQPLIQLPWPQQGPGPPSQSRQGSSGKVNWNRMQH